MLEGSWCRFRREARTRENREPVSEIDAGLVDGLKVLDSEQPIKEAGLNFLSD